MKRKNKKLKIKIATQLLNKMAPILIPIIILFFYSGWFVWPLLYLRKIKKYTWGKAIIQSFFVLFLLSGIGIAVSDLIVVSDPKNSVGITIFAIFWIIFPYGMLLLRLRKNDKPKKNENS